MSWEDSGFFISDKERFFSLTSLFSIEYTIGTAKILSIVFINLVWIVCFSGPLKLNDNSFNPSLAKNYS